MRKWLRRLARQEKGATAVEYGLIAGLIVIALLVGLQAFADVTVSMWNRVSSTVDDAIG